ncbi:MAG: HD domain-containing phosphohydrolase, partial [Anaerolineales bacterium]
HGFEFLAPINYLRPSLDIPYCHHERWDGSGYPRGLRGDHIPMAARVFALVDTWDALRADRPFRAAWPAERALAFIRAQSGLIFDPRLTELFLQSAANGRQ